jgi:hypothetical protein
MGLWSIIDIQLKASGRAGRMDAVQALTMLLGSSLGFASLGG